MCFNIWIFCFGCNMICNQSNEVGKNNIKSKCYFCCFVQIKFIENSVNACQSSMECCPSLWSTFEMHHAYIAAGWVWSKNMKMMPQLILINCIKLLTLEQLCVGNLAQHVGLDCPHMLTLQLMIDYGHCHCHCHHHYHHKMREPWKLGVKKVCKLVPRKIFRPWH